jgi:hypothetical protein
VALRGAREGFAVAREVKSGKEHERQTFHVKNDAVLFTLHSRENSAQSAPRSTLQTQTKPNENERQSPPAPLSFLSSQCLVRNITEEEGYSDEDSYGGYGGGCACGMCGYGFNIFAISQLFRRPSVRREKSAAAENKEVEMTRRFNSIKETVEKTLVEKTKVSDL